MNEKNKNYLQAIAIGFYVLGGLGVLIGLLPLMHIAFGIMIVTGKLQNHPSSADEIAWLFILIGMVAMVVMETIAILLLYTGRCIQRRKRHLFCLVMSAVSCLASPLGTILGIFSMIMLTKPEIKAEFEAAVPAAVPE